MNNKNSKTTLGERIKIARVDKNLTQEQLGAAVGLKAITIRQYESNKRAPGIKTLKKIAQALKMPLQLLIYDDDDVSAYIDNILQETYENNDNNKSFIDFIKKSIQEIGFDCITLTAENKLTVGISQNDETFIMLVNLSDINLILKDCEKEKNELFKNKLKLLLMDKYLQSTKNIVLSSDKNKQTDTK